MNRLSLIVILAIVAGITSCTPKSAMNTKVVVLDATQLSIEGRLEYKVRYISYDVVDYIYTPFEFTEGDTIMVHDKYRNRDIR